MTEETSQPIDGPYEESWFSGRTEYRKRDGVIEARNNLNPDWVAVGGCEEVDTERLNDKYWNPWFAALLKLASNRGCVTSDDADCWWDDFCNGMSPHASWDAFLASDEGAAFLCDHSPALIDIPES